MLKAVADILDRRGTDGWLVGGSVRDRLLGRYSPDLDVVVADDAAAVARQLAAALGASWFALSERHPTYRVLGADGYVDVAAVRGEINTDLGLRDFTVNAMAVPVAAVAEAAALDVTGILDPFGGLVHLRERRLVAVSEHIFTDDPVRLMRAPRFCHTLGLRLDDDLARKMRGQAAVLAGAAVERVVSEMCLTFAAGRAAAATRLWEESGLLAVVLPESSTGDAPGAGARAPDGSPATTTRCGPDRSATLSLLERLDDILERPAEQFPEAADILAARLPEPVDGAVARPVALRLAGLTYGLPVQGVRAASRRLKLSGAMRSLLTAIAKTSASEAGPRIGGAGRPWTLEELLPGQTTVSREAVLFLWDAEPWEPEAIMLAAAAGGGSGPTGAAARRLMCLYALRVGGRMPPLPLGGDSLMRELGLEPGPALGRALHEARLAWEAGEVRTAGEALAVAREAAVSG